MNLLYDEEYWSSRFDVTRIDLDRTADRLEQAGLPLDLKDIALPILRERMENGPGGDRKPTSIPDGRVPVRLWDPSGEWHPGDVLLLIHDRFGNLKYDVLMGEIVQVDLETVEIRTDPPQGTRTYLRTLPGTENAQRFGSAAGTWRDLVFEQVERRLRSADPEEQAEGILLRNGEYILARLVDALGRDCRFIGLAGKWHLLHRLPRLQNDSLQAVHHFLLRNGPASLDDILPVVMETRPGEPGLMRLALHAALGQATDRFAYTGTSSRTQWQARLPALDRAEVTHFAFDPQTFELLCRPGQRLNPKKAQRLQELDLYAHVVTFPEWQPGAGT